jgi:hypothetical protein
VLYLGALPCLRQVLLLLLLAGFGLGGGLFRLTRPHADENSKDVLPPWLGFAFRDSWWGQPTGDGY